MGIDIYAVWKNQTEEEHKSQLTGFSVCHGHVGYLREAYHGSPYATRYLVSEAFEKEGACVKISASILRERLSKTLEIACERNTKLYNGDCQEEVLKSFVDFVELCERKQKETGESVAIKAIT